MGYRGMRWKFAWHQYCHIIGFFWILIVISQANVDICQSMGLYFCSECENTPFQCHACTTGYTLNANKTGCLECTEKNCQECSLDAAHSTKTVCEGCSPGYYLNETDKTCLACDIAGCRGCHLENGSAMICDLCEPFYYSVNDSHCEACHASCKVCTATKCIECERSNYVISGSEPMKCVPCPTSDQCTSCITGDRAVPAKCLSCVEGYFISADQCVACAVSNCKSCPVGSVCEDCNDYYFNSRANLCSQCGFMCKKCLNNATCEQCSAGYTAKNPGLVTCDECPDNCEICTTEQMLIGGCTRCYSGYTLDLLSSSCLPCKQIDNCAVCRSTGGMLTCTTCQPGYLLVGNICHDCGGCTSCTWNETASRIQCQCPTVTDNPDNSIDDPYAFRGHCPSGGYACQPGYMYLRPVDSSGASSCVACIDGCRYCNSTTGCIQCNPDRNYAVEPKDDATCFSCTTTSEACISCSGKQEIFQCDECAAGYYLEDSNCEACPTNCADCINSTSCAICMKGAVKGTDGLCHACSENCQNCTLDDESGATFCTQCSDSYTEKNGKCEACPNHCHTCSEVADVLVCTSCQQHYTTNDHVCAACPVNCETCRTDGINVVCHICKDEFYLDPEKTCRKCIYGCLKCLDGTNCDVCRPGRGLTADRRSCIGCQFLTDVFNCASCTDSTVNTKAKCTSCMTGYTLSDDATQCFNIYSFGRQCTDVSDWPPSCTKCQEDVGAELIDNKCLINCYACGSYDNNEWPTSTVEQCNTLGAINTHTTYCQYGCAITISYLDDEVSFMARGCKSNTTCPEDGTEECMMFGRNKLCTNCCMSKPLCNGDCSRLSLTTNCAIHSLFLLSLFILTSFVIQY